MLEDVFQIITPPINFNYGYNNIRERMKEWDDWLPFNSTMWARRYWLIAERQLQEEEVEFIQTVWLPVKQTAGSDHFLDLSPLPYAFKNNYYIIS